MAKRKAYMITEGGKGIGFGHIVRCSALYNAFENSGMDVEFIVNGDDTVRGLLKEKKHVFMEWRRTPAEFMDMVSGADVAVIDSYLADEPFYRRIAGCVKTPVFIDDHRRLDYPDGIIINSAILADSLEYPEKKGTVYLLGREYALLREEFSRVPEKKISDKLTTIFLTCGGSDTENYTERVLSILLEDFPGMKINVVIGKTSGIHVDAGRFSGGEISVIFNADADQMKALILESDIAVSAAGQTLYELARAGVPAVGISLADNQALNLEGWERFGVKACFNPGDTRELGRCIRDGIMEFESPGKRAEYRDRARRFIDGKGALRVYDAVAEALGDHIAIRKAVNEDCRDIWIWRNDPEARRWSFNDGAISYEDHKGWFGKKMSDRGVRIYIAENEGGKAGQARLELAGGGKAVVSVNMNPEFFGRGFGRVLIRKATERFTEEMGEVSSVLAEIDVENRASIKAFGRAGYRLKGDTVRNGKKAYVYEYRKNG
ncbi:MAG: bifunctional UDP-2,4-diacetamido-2,4,6-trideoxy-beta-L-altropyranose hydrolase/GNAT family N-acetyltransferase [Candidatus Omnitrophota bacterium]